MSCMISGTRIKDPGIPILISEAFNPMEFRVSLESVNEHVPRFGACELEFATGFSIVLNRYSIF